MVATLVALLCTAVLCGGLAFVCAAIAGSPAVAKLLYYVVGLFFAFVAMVVTSLMFWVFGSDPAFSRILTGVLLGYIGAGQVLLSALLAQKFGGS
ncbi:hypothetical protein [Rothia sp. P4278]|uniref:hypothetical protein n=1 Tax=Rothia sp. P4278 TaxID=3402658 RepID=UPI003ADF40DE